MKKIIVLLFFVLLLTGCTPTIEYVLEAGTDTIEVFEDHDLKGCSVNINSQEHQMDVIENTVDNQEIGEYIVEYEVEVDEELYTCQRVVFVVDQTKPVLTLLPGVDTVRVNESWMDAGVEVTDNYDQDVMVLTIYNEDDFAATSSISFRNVGTFEVHYVATDDSGNEATITRYVHVIEGE